MERLLSFFCLDIVCPFLSRVPRPSDKRRTSALCGGDGLNLNIYERLAWLLGHVHESKRDRTVLVDVEVLFRR